MTTILATYGYLRWNFEWSRGRSSITKVYRHDYEGHSHIRNRSKSDLTKPLGGPGKVKRGRDRKSIYRSCIIQKPAFYSFLWSASHCYSDPSVTYHCVNTSTIIWHILAGRDSFVIYLAADRVVRRILQKISVTYRKRPNSSFYRAKCIDMFCSTWLQNDEDEYELWNLDHYKRTRQVQ